MGFRRGRQSGDRSRILPAPTLADPHRQTGKRVPLDFPARRRCAAKQPKAMRLHPPRHVRQAMTDALVAVAAECLRIGKFQCRIEGVPENNSGDKRAPDQKTETEMNARPRQCPCNALSPSRSVVNVGPRAAQTWRAIVEWRKLRGHSPRDTIPDACVAEPTRPSARPKNTIFAE